MILIYLFEQNNENNCHQPTSPTAVGKAKVISYKDILGAQAKHDAREVTLVKGKPGPKRRSSAPIPT